MMMLLTLGLATVATTAAAAVELARRRTDPLLALSTGTVGSWLGLGIAIIEPPTPTQAVLIAATVALAVLATMAATVLTGSPPEPGIDI